VVQATTFSPLYKIMSTTEKCMNCMAEVPVLYQRAQPHHVDGYENVICSHMIAKVEGAVAREVAARSDWPEIVDPSIQMAEPHLRKYTPGYFSSIKKLK
jgi:hypothetical protein